MVSVVLPVHDEVAWVEPGILALSDWLEGMSWELVIIDLGSIDGSAELLGEFSESQNVKLVLEEEPLGKGYACRLGALMAAGDWVFLADLRKPMDARPLIEDRHRLEDVGLAVYTPLHRKGRGAPLRNKISARLMRRKFSAGDGAQPVDPDGGLVLIDKHLALELFPLCTQVSQLYTYELLQLAAMKGYAFVELPADARRWTKQTWFVLGRILCGVKAVRQGLNVSELPGA